MNEQINTTLNGSAEGKSTTNFILTVVLYLFIFGTFIDVWWCYAAKLI